MYTFVFTIDESPPLVHIITVYRIIVFKGFQVLYFFRGEGYQIQAPVIVVIIIITALLFPKRRLQRNCGAVKYKYRTSLQLCTIQQGYCTGSFPVTSAIGKRFFMLVTKFSETKHLNFYPKLRDKQHNILLSIF